MVSLSPGMRTTLTCHGPTSRVSDSPQGTWFPGLPVREWFVDLRGALRHLQVVPGLAQPARLGRLLVVLSAQQLRHLLCREEQVGLTLLQRE